MFENFYKFAGINDINQIEDIHGFMEKYSGRTFLGGLYRIHNKKDIKKWNNIIGKSFPAAYNNVEVFGYDWAGRNFAVYDETNTVLIFEPGTGEAFDTGMDFFEFHDEEIPQNHTVCLMSEYFQEWKDSSNCNIAHDQCVGYKVPLFLNGKDEVENLEVSDMEVYWEIMMPLMNM